MGPALRHCGRLGCSGRQLGGCREVSCTPEHVTAESRRAGRLPQALHCLPGCSRGGLQRLETTGSSYREQGRRAAGVVEMWPGSSHPLPRHPAAVTPWALRPEGGRGTPRAGTRSRQGCGEQSGAGGCTRVLWAWGCLSWASAMPVSLGAAGGLWANVTDGDTCSPPEDPETLLWEAPVTTPYPRETYQTCVELRANGWEGRSASRRGAGAPVSRLQGVH